MRRPGWVVDLSEGKTVNPAAYWYFKTRSDATKFIDLLNEGKSAREARPRRGDENLIWCSIALERGLRIITYEANKHGASGNAQTL